MWVYVQKKSVGRYRRGLDKQKIEVGDNIRDLEDLLRVLCHREIEAYNNRTTQSEILFAQEELQNLYATGKVVFGSLTDSHDVNEEEAFLIVKQAFADGLLRVFQNEEELLELHQPIVLNQEDTITIMKLVMLAGRLW